MQCKQRFYIYHVKYDWHDEVNGVLLSSPDSGDSEHTLVGSLAVEFEIPDNFDPRPQQIKALQEKERQLRADFAKSITEIQARIAELSAIEYVEA